MEEKNCNYQDESCCSERCTCDQAALNPTLLNFTDFSKLNYIEIVIGGQRFYTHLTDVKFDLSRYGNQGTLEMKFTIDQHAPKKD